MTAWHIIVDGAPRTKKTHNVMAHAGRHQRGRGIVLPSKAWVRWTREAKIEVEIVHGAIPSHWVPIAVMQPVRSLVSCRALFYRDANRGDAVGYYQGLADLLQKRTVIVDDKQIVHWDGSRLLKDAARPRVELWLEVVEAAVEQTDLVAHG